METVRELLRPAAWVEFERSEDNEEHEEEELPPSSTLEGSEDEAFETDMICRGVAAAPHKMRCVDLATLSHASRTVLQQALPHILRVRVELMAPTLSGQVDAEEAARLAELCQRVTAALEEARVPAALVSEEAGGKWCNWDYFTASAGPGVTAALEAVQKEEYTYALDMATIRDGEWHHLEWMQPTAEERLWILCKANVKALMAGSATSEPELCPGVARPVWHVVTFEESEAVARFAADAFRAGFFPVTHPLTERFSGEGEEVACFMRTDEVTLPQIFEVVQNLAAAAEHHSGRYRTWDTETMQSIPKDEHQEEGQAEAAFARTLLSKAEGEE